MTLMTKDEAKRKAAALRKELRAAGQGESACVVMWNGARYSLVAPDDKAYCIMVTSRTGRPLRHVGT